MPKALSEVDPDLDAPLHECEWKGLFWIFDNRRWCCSVEAVAPVE